MKRSHLSGGPSRRPAPRRGLISVALLVGLLILGIIAAGLIRVERARRDAARAEERSLQADLLLDAAIDRARLLLRADPRFTGEVWEPTAADLAEPGGARIAITVRPGPEAETRTIAAAVELTVAPKTTIRRTRTRDDRLPPPAPR